MSYCASNRIGCLQSDNWFRVRINVSRFANRDGLFKVCDAKKAQKLIKSRCKFCTRIFRVCYMYVTLMLCILFAYVTDIVIGVYCAYSSCMLCVFFARIIRANSSHVTHNPCVWYPYSSCILRMRYALSLRMICGFFVYVVCILRIRCASTLRTVWYAYSSHMLRIILVHMRILRVCCAHSSHRYALSLRMICVLFAYVTHHPCVHHMRILCVCYAYPRVSRVFFAHVTPILHKCSRRGVVAPFPQIFRQNAFTKHFWNVNSNPVVNVWNTNLIQNVCDQITKSDPKSIKHADRQSNLK